MLCLDWECPVPPQVSSDKVCEVIRVAGYAIVDRTGDPSDPSKDCKDCKEPKTAKVNNPGPWYLTLSR